MIIEHYLELIIPYVAGSLEAIGVAIIIISAIRCIFRFFKNRFNFKDANIAIEFAKAMSLSLEFKLAAEIIKTVVIRTIEEFIVLAAIALLRVILTLVLHWEISNESKGNHDNHQINV